MSDNPAARPVATAPISVQLHLVPPDVVQAYQLHARGQLWSRSMFLSLGLSLTFIAALCVATIEDHLVIAEILAGSLIGGLAFPRAMIRWRVPIVARRIHRQQKDLHRPYDVVFGPDGLRVSSESGFASTAWSDYVRLREDASMALLYHSDALFQMVPKRILTEAQLAIVRSWFAAAHAASGKA